MRAATGRAARLLLAARLGSGLLLATRPSVGLRLFGSDEDDATSRVVVRVLGARHLLQGLAEASGGPFERRLGAGVDLLHAVTALGYATVSRAGRSAGRRSAALALSFAVAELVVARQASAAERDSAPPARAPGAPTTELAVLRGGVMDQAEVAVDIHDDEYTVADSMQGPQRYVRSFRTVAEGPLDVPVFVLQQAPDGGS